MNLPSEVISSYVNGLVCCSCCQVGEQDHQYVQHHGLGEYMFHKITSSEFRRSKVDDELANDIRTKIQSHLDDGSPISFAIPFGAYKHWRTWSYPEPEWAEVFNVSYMLRYAAPLAAMYAPGIALHYSYGDCVMDTVSNMPPADTETYIARMKSLIGLFQERAPSNVKIDCVRINDFYSKEEHAAEFRAHYEDNLQNWERKHSEADRKSKLESALRNLMPKGIEDLTGLNDEQWQRRALNSAMWCDAHDSLSRRRGFNKHSGHIQVGNIRGRRLELHVGSCDTSVHQFWVGVGFLEARRKGLLPRIVSQEKLEFLKVEMASTGEPNMVRMDVSNEFEHFGDNYRSIYVLDCFGGRSG